MKNFILIFVLFFAIKINALEYKSIKDDNSLKIAIYFDKFGNDSGTDLNNRLISVDSLNQFYSFIFAAPDENFESKITVFNKKGLEISPYSINNVFIIKSSGIQRDIKLFQITVPKSAVDNYSKSDISKIIIQISFNKKFNILNFNNQFYDSAFFADVENLEQIPAIRKSYPKTKTADAFQNSLVWYNPKLDYVKIETKKDGVASVNLVDIIKLLPDIQGKSTKYLHLLHNGKDVFFQIPNDDGLLDAHDRLYFLGKRAAGDTTWFENYTNRESFYITYDNSYPSSQYENILQASSPQPEKIDKIYINHHIEKDLIYEFGTSFERHIDDNSVEKSNYLDTRTVMGEGWYWAVISPVTIKYIAEYDRLINNNVINPTGNSLDSLSIGVFYRSIQDSIDGSLQGLPIMSTYYDVNFDVNNKYKIQHQFMGFVSKTLNLKVSGNDLFSGNNPLRIAVKEVYPQTNQRLGVDYFTISGLVKPIAEGKTIDFQVKKTSDIELPFYGFNSDSIVMIDTVYNRIGVYNSVNSGTLFRAGAGFTDSSYVTLSINDSTINTKNQGLHIFILPAPDFKTYQYISAFDNTSSTVEKLNALPDGSIIIAAASGVSNVSAFKPFFESLGSKNIGSVQGNFWTFGGIKGKPELAVENIDPVLSNISSFVNHETGKSYSYNLKIKNDEKSYYFASSSNDIESPVPVLSSKSDLRNINSAYDGFYISHKNFYAAAVKLKDYREKTQNVKILTIDVEDIFKEFGFGKNSPHAIKDFLTFAYSNFKEPKPKYVLLIGDASYDCRKLIINSVSNNYMPTYGNPVSDWWYGCLEGENDFKPELFVSRLPVNTIQQAYDYIDKVIAYDTTENRPWMKNFLFLTGGGDTRERNQFFSYITDRYQEYITDSEICGKIDYIRKDGNAPSSSSQANEIMDKINPGNLWTVFIGHAATEVFDLDGWNAPYLNNKDRYGILSTISCNTGAFAEPLLIASRNEQYILEKDKGYIASMGSTTVGILDPHNMVVSQMIARLADSSAKERNMAQIFNYGKSKMYPISIQLYTLYQFSLLGDPFINVRLGKKPDLYALSSEIKSAIPGGASQANDKMDSVGISGYIYNYGYKAGNTFKTILLREYSGKTDTLELFYNGLCNKDSFAFHFPIKGMTGRHNFKLIIDPDKISNDENYSNNVITFSLDVFKEGLIALDPQNNWNVDSKNPKFRVLNPFGLTSDYNYEFMTSAGIDTNIFIFNKANTINLNSKEITIAENYIDWNPVINNFPDSTVYLFARFISKVDNNESEWLQIPFCFDNTFQSDKVKWQINSSDSSRLGKFENLAFDKINNENRIQLKRQALPFYALGFCGIRDTNHIYLVEPHTRLTVGDNVFITGYAGTGFHVAVFSSHPNGITTRYKLFDTWGNDASHTTGWWKDSTSVDLVRFLRDSIRDDDYVLMSTMRSSFRLPVYFKIFAQTPCEGSVDTLFSELRKFGSKVADTLVLDINNQGFQISYAMLGYKGAKVGSVPEAINMLGDSADISGELVIFEKNGTLYSGEIGMAKKWKGIYLMGDFPRDSTNFEIDIFGKKYDSNYYEYIKSDTNAKFIDLSDINALEYPYISYNIRFIKDNMTIAGTINEAPAILKASFVSFEPLPELAVSKINTSLDNNDILRGTPVNLNFQVENISLRTKVDSADTEINISKGGVNNDYHYVQSLNFLPDSKLNYSLAIITDELDKTNPIYIKLNKDDNPKEHYFFNNNYQLILNSQSDTLKPNILLKVDGRILKPGDYIRIQPEFEVELYDNSRLKFTDENCITVRINGFLHPFQRTISHEFKSYSSGAGLKAVFKFIPDTLQYEDVSIVVYYNDIEGNKDTLQTYARVTLLNAIINDVVPFPNPSDGNVNISLDYKAPNPGATAITEIYNYTGIKISKVETILNLGNNTVEFNGLTESGESLPTGIYFYRISLKNDFFIEPIFGKFTIIK
jgi:hypothetical protein